MTAYQITREDESRACVVRMSGDIDISVVPRLRQDLDTALDRGCTHVVLDLNEVVYVDSSALGLLVWLDHRLRPSDGKLFLAGPNADVGRILELSGLVAVAMSVTISASVESALEGLEMTPIATEPMWSRQLNMPIDVNQLGIIRESVCETLAPLEFPESSVFDVKVALGEALANALRHGVGSREDGEVKVNVIAYADRVVIEVMDNGPGFDGTQTSNNDVYAVSGRGIMFMRALMDQVEFEPSPLGGTLVRIVKHRPGCV